MAKLVTIRVVVSDDSAAFDLADRLHSAATAALGTPKGRIDPLCVHIDSVLNPLPADDLVLLTDGQEGQLFDSITGEEVIGRALSIPAVGGYRSARKTARGIELMGEHLYEVLEQGATTVKGEGPNNQPVYVTITGRRIAEERVVVKALAGEAAGATS